jgi:hypothetical protein
MAEGGRRGQSGIERWDRRAGHMAEGPWGCQDVTEVGWQSEEVGEGPVWEVHNLREARC